MKEGAVTVPARTLWRQGLSLPPAGGQAREEPANPNRRCALQMHDAFDLSRLREHVQGRYRYEAKRALSVRARSRASVAGLHET